MERALSMCSLHGALGELTSVRCKELEWSVHFQLVFSASIMNGACTFNVLVSWCIKRTHWFLVQGAWMERALS